MTGPVGRASRPRVSGDGGQSTVELALALPAVSLLILLVVQVASVVHDRILLDAAAREAVRAAAVTVDPAVAVRAAAGGGLASDRLDVDVTRRPGADGELVEVRVRFSSPTEVPLVGALLPDVELVASATMRAEGP